MKIKNISRYLKILFCFFALLILTIIIWLGLGRYEFLGKQKEGKVFISHIITSILEDTDFYKKNSDGDAQKKIVSNKEIISDTYVISTIDYSWGIYEAFIIFNNGSKAKVDVTFINNGPFLKHFRVIKVENDKVE